MAALTRFCTSSLLLVVENSCELRDRQIEFVFGAQARDVVPFIFQAFRNKRTGFSSLAFSWAVSDIGLAIFYHANAFGLNCFDFYSMAVDKLIAIVSFDGLCIAINCFDGP